MFHKLRKQFILTTMSLVAVVLLISFSVIYISASKTFYSEAPIKSGPFAVRLERLDNETRLIIDNQRKDLIDKSLRNLLVALLVSGAAILIAVYFVSRYIANRAVGTIESAYIKQRRFIADAGHELKTPIAVIGTNAEAAIADGKNPSRWLGNIREESERMGRLVNDLLLLAKLDDATITPRLSQFDLDELIEGTVKGFEPLIKKKGLSVSTKLKVHGMTGDQDRLRQLLTILIDNAVKYTKHGDKIVVSSHAMQDAILVEVSNTHEEITSEEIEKFFDRFYQADSSHRAGGYGLGLSIAKDIALQIEAKLKAEYAGGMLVFRLEVPRISS